MLEKDAQPAVSARLSRERPYEHWQPTSSSLAFRLVSNSRSLVQSNSLTKSDAVGRFTALLWSGRPSSPARRMSKHTADARVVTPSGCCSLGTAKIRRCWSA